MNTHVVAVDLGASSGRVLLATHDAQQCQLKLEEIHRFPNRFVRSNGHDCWDVEGLLSHIELGLEMIIEQGIVPASIGIDTWGVDFVLVDAAGDMVGQAVSYRDSRTDGVMEDVLARIPRDELYARTGIQFQQFNTLYQLAALMREQPEELGRAQTLMLMADYLHFRLCGVQSCEYTNASTTQLINLKTRNWDFDLIRTLGLPAHWFQPPCQPGTSLGEWQSRGGMRVKVITPATHDTASAVLATPLQSKESLYISSGTWSLLGVESPLPYADKYALQTNFTNEGGAGNQYRVLKNIMGLWLIQRVRDAFPMHSFAELVKLAEAEAPLRYLINPDENRFLNPSSMLKAIQSFCHESEQGIPQRPGEVARCVFESLAFQYRKTLGELEILTGLSFERIHIVGGGSQNRFLNQLCADFCRLPVHAGPVEASALGNIICQLVSSKRIVDLPAAREFIRKNFAGDIFMPDNCNASLAEQHWQRFQTLCRPAQQVTSRISEGALHE